MTVEITVGAHVITSDGKELGTVKRVEASAFLLDVPHNYDYWLETELAATLSSGRIQLSIDSEQVGAYKMDRPRDHNQFMAGTPTDRDRATIQGEALRDSNRPNMSQ